MTNKNKYILIGVLIIIALVSLFFLMNKSNEDVINNGEVINNENELNEEDILREKTLVAVGKANDGDKEGALNDYLSLLEEYPNDLLLLNNTAVLYSDMGDWEKSEEYYLRLLEAYPTLTQGYRMLAYLYQYRFDDGEAKALALIEEGLIKTDNDPNLIRWLIGYYTEKDNEEMKNYYLEMIGE